MSVHYVTEVKITKVEVDKQGNGRGLGNAGKDGSYRNIEEVTHIVHKGNTLGKVIATSKAMLDIVDGEQEFDE